MCSDRNIPCLLVLLSLMILCSCSVSRRISELRDSGKNVVLSLPSDYVEEKDTAKPSSTEYLPDGKSVIMNAVLDSITGDMVASDVIQASKITARFRHAAERNGKVSLAFDVSVPPEMLESAWQLRLYPVMDILGDSLCLEPLFVTGAGYRSAQEKGYQRYKAFLSSIIKDSTDFLMLHSLEMFIQRYFPDTYSMKTDSSYVSADEVENIFGVCRKEVVEHYTRQGLIRRNERKKKISEKLLSKVIAPVNSKVRLDTVIYSSSGELVYRYVQTIESRPGLKKIPVSVSGGIYELGRQLYSFPEPENIVFYISSLSALADTASKYTFKVIERNVYEDKIAVIDFSQGSSQIDLSLGRNEDEFNSVMDWAGKILSSEKYETDSIVVTASCSLEGRYSFNELLSRSRAESAMLFFSNCFPDLDKQVFKASYIPENWSGLKKMVASDNRISRSSKNAILSFDAIKTPDCTEMKLKSLPEYEYIKESLYPGLRNVKFGIFMHRKGMQKDTVHTAEIDSTYMEGVKALTSLDYRKAIELLGKYEDYNSALAYLSAGYDEKAWKVISKIREHTPKSYYLASLALSRLGKLEKAYRYFKYCVEADSYMLHRGRLDPEMNEVVKQYENERY